MSEPASPAAQFEKLRPHLASVAYGMLGSVSDAGDAVQLAWLRLSRSDADAINDMKAWLTTVVGRICLDLLRARRARPEDAAGAWLPERRLVDPHPAQRLLPGQGHHDRACIKAGDLGPPLQQFTQVQAGAAGCVQDLSARDGPECGQHRRAIVMGVVGAVRRMLLKAHAHLVVGIPQVLAHADSMTHAATSGWPAAFRTTSGEPGVDSQPGTPSRWRDGVRKVVQFLTIGGNPAGRQVRTKECRVAYPH